MPEIKERDPLADAFFDLRMQAPQEILVPGSGEAKRTVKHRRRARVAAVAAVVLLVVVGGGLAVDGQSRRQSASPALTTQELDQLGVRALARLGHQPGMARPSMRFGGLTAAALDAGYTFGTPAEPFPPGDYTVTAVCVGTGDIDLIWDDRGQVRHLPVKCGDDPVARSELRLVTPGTIRMWLSADASAVGRAGTAVAVTDPQTVAARHALGTPVGQIAGGSAFAERSGPGDSGVSRMDMFDSARPGYYTLSVVCVGVGSIRATLTIGDATESESAHCGAAPSPITLSLRVTQVGPRVTVRLDPDDRAAGAAGYAYASTIRPLA